VTHASHQRTADAMIEHLLFGHEPHLPAQTLFVGGQAGEGEIEVAGVVDRHHGAAAPRHVLHAGYRERQTLKAPQQASHPDGGSVHRLHGISLVPGAAAKLVFDPSTTRD